MRSRCLFAWISLGFCPGWVQASTPIAASDVVATCTEVRRLGALLAARPGQAQPVSLEGTVVFVDTSSRTVFLHDGTGSIAVEGWDGRDPMAPGSRIRVDGTVSLGTFGPTVRASRIRTVGIGALQEAIPLSYQDVLSGSEQHQWVRVRGVGRTATNVEGGAELRVATDFGVIRVLVSGASAAEIGRLIDGRLIVRGVCELIVNQRHQVAGFRLLAPGLGSLGVEEAGAVDPFSLPVRPIDTLARYSEVPPENPLILTATAWQWPRCVRSRLGICTHVIYEIALDCTGQYAILVAMYVERIPNRTSPPAILLREAWREAGRVRKRTVANLTDWPPARVEALRRVLRDEPLVRADELFTI